MSKTLLALNNITVTFKTRRGSFKAIEDLNLQLKEGEILGFMGCVQEMQDTKC